MSDTLTSKITKEEVDEILKRVALSLQHLT